MTAVDDVWNSSVIDEHRYLLAGVDLDDATAVHLRRELDALLEEFATTASREDVEHAFAVAVREQAAGARVRDFLPVLVRRRVRAELKRPLVAQA